MAVSPSVSMKVTGRVRPAELRDVPALVAIRSALSLPWPDVRERASSAGRSTRGFLLGSSPAVYASYVTEGAVLVAEAAGEVVAYSVVLPDRLLRSSEVYEKRGQAGLDAGLLRWLEGSRVAYYDQLASLPGHGAAAVSLAYQHLLRTLETHDALLATTVLEPVRNVAAVPLLLGAGFTAVGEIDEVYPEVGRIRSCVYAATREGVTAVRSTEQALRFEGRLAST